MTQTREHFEAWRRAQPPARSVPGYEHALFVRWCASVLSRGERIDLDPTTRAPGGAR